MPLHSGFVTSNAARFLDVEKPGALAVKPTIYWDQTRRNRPRDLLMIQREARQNSPHPRAPLKPRNLKPAGQSLNPFAHR